VQAAATITELILMDGLHAARINCPVGMVPAPGQYLLAHEAGSDAPLATVVYSARPLADGMISAPGVPGEWNPGTRLHLRGPLGHGFTLPSSASRVALIAWDDGPRRLLALLEPASRQNASVTLVCENPPEELPWQIEVLPLKALGEVLKWAHYAAFDAARESLPGLKNKLRAGGKSAARAQAQVLVRVPMPCGGLAQCGVCTIRARRENSLACEEGPVFDLGLLDFES
jgi:hypothetical protein